MYEVIPQRETSAESDLTSRLRDLERAREGGLITDEEFRRKRNELLDRW